MQQLLRGPAGIYGKYTVELAKASDFMLRNEDEEVNHLAGFIVDRGSYPWDVVT